MLRKIFIFIILQLVILSSQVMASKQIVINKGHVSAIPMAINLFDISPELNDSNMKKLINVIDADLKNSGVFTTISKAAFIEQHIGIKHIPLFAAWQQINASLLLNGRIELVNAGNIKISYILWDTYIEKPLLQDEFTIDLANLRKAAHIISDKIYHKITGFEGYFNTKIVYVSESGEYLHRKKRLAIMDYDGANHRYLTDGQDLVLTPRFSPEGDRIMFLSYKGDVARVYQMELSSGKTKVIGDFPGMSFAPRFSPSGKFAVFSIAKDGQTHIYELNLRSGRKIRLTDGTSINTSPCYSKDGKHIVFNSDRFGSKQLFIMNRDGTEVQRLSFSGGSYSEPNWSSKDMVAFTKTSRDFGFTIGLLKPYSLAPDKAERLLTNGYLVESPSWSGGGRQIVFTRGIKPISNNDRMLNRIYTIDFTGHNEKIIPTPNDASDPDWSPRLD